MKIFTGLSVKSIFGGLRCLGDGGSVSIEYVLVPEFGNLVKLHILLLKFGSVSNEKETACFGESVLLLRI